MLIIVIAVGAALIVRTLPNPADKRTRDYSGHAPPYLSREAAQLEASKAFAKKLMRHADVPTAEFRVFDHPQPARDDKLPAERKDMTREQLAHEYGSDPKPVQAIESFAREHGLVVNRKEPASARMGLAGTADTISTPPWRHADGP